MPTPPIPIQTVSYLKYLQPWLQAARLGAGNIYQAGKIGAGNIVKKLTHTPVQLKFNEKALNEVVSKIQSTDDGFIKALDTFRGNLNLGAPVTLQELREMAALSPHIKQYGNVVTNYIKNSGVDAAGLLGIGLANQATKWNALTNALQPGQTLKFDPLTRTLQAIDDTGLAVLRFSPAKTLGVVAGTGGAGYGVYEGYNAVSKLLEEKDMTPLEYFNNIVSSPDFTSVSNEPATVDLPATDTPQTTENLPPAEQLPTPPVSSTLPPASAEVPATTETTTDTSFVDKALQWGRDNPDLVSLLSLLAVGAGGVGLYNLLDDDDEEEDEEEY